MISFKEFLKEATSYPLYHATSFRDARSILQHDEFFGSTSDESEPYGLSATRNINTAWKFGTLKYGSRVETVVFELNREKLKHRYRVVPYNYWGDPMNGGVTRFLNDRHRHTGDFNEYEEKILFKKSIPALQFIEKVMIYSPNVLNQGWIPPSYTALKKSPKLYIYTTKEWVKK